MAQSSSLVFRRRESVQRIGKPTKGITLRIAFTVIASIALILVLYIQYRILKSFDSQSQNVWNILNQNKKKSLDQRHHSKDPATHGQDPRRSLTLTAYLEPPSTLTYTKTNSRRPWFARNTTAAALKVIEFPRRQICDRTRILPDLPIDDFPTDDPFLPWLHDYFVSEDGRHIRFVAQNKRRCDTGDQHSHTMAFWEPQVTLFQSIPVVTEPNDKEKFRFATSLEEATHPATRFQCRFFHPATNQTMTTLSLYKFDYEYITWRKLRRPMIDRKGKDATMFWLSTLLFSCPIPEPWQHRIMRSSMTPFPNLYLDLVPIRTPIRTDLVLLTINHTGPDEYTGLQRRLFPLDKVFGQQHIIPPIEDAGRWANLPICPRPEEERMRLPDTSQAIEHTKPSNPKRRFRFVACTWTAASYTRRGDEVQVSDSASRLREWILFHLMVGVEHVYIYDNTNIDNITTTPSDLWHVAQEFPKNQVTYHSWPCKICNNNRPAHSNPGERSSQYAAEASCRERYGPLTEWMTFIDVDEYLVPMKAMGDNNKPYDWRPILDEMKAKQVPILQFLSSRARPRVDMMEELEDQSSCKDPTGKKNEKFPNTDRCVGPKRDELFLKIYNCEYIRPPKPSRFARARKQIYQPDYVWSHFVHYSTVTADYAETYSEFIRRGSKGKYLSNAHGPSWERKYPDVFVDELTTGTLIHARSVMPHETRRRSLECTVGSGSGCMMGYVCEESVEFIDDKHQDNLFTNSDGSYCNCWTNSLVSKTLAPMLEKRMRRHLESLNI